jgi:hypothetical protein
VVCGLGGANGGSVPLFVTIATTAFERECVGTHARFPVLSVWLVRRVGSVQKNPRGKMARRAFLAANRAHYFAKIADRDRTRSKPRTDDLLHGVLNELVERIQLLPGQAFLFEERADHRPRVLLADLLIAGPQIIGVHLGIGEELLHGADQHARSRHPTLATCTRPTRTFRSARKRRGATRAARSESRLAAAAARGKREVFRGM